VGLTVRLEDALPDRRQQDEIDQLGIELAASLGRDGVGGMLRAQRVAIAPSVGDRVERVGDGDDARGEGDAGAAQAARVAAAVPPLVV